MASKREIELARHLRRNATLAERTAWELLRDKRCQGIKFKRQYPVGGFIVDLYAPQLKLVIELDGAVHNDRQNAERDALRTAELESIGLRVVRLRNEEVNAVSLARVIDEANALPLSVASAMERGPGGEAERGGEAGG